MAVYYNENDEYCAAWLRNLIAAKVIPAGEVDSRDIRDVRPVDLRGFTQCHFFAGIGVWAYALRVAGWPDDRPVWTGSCPCQPFSSAGQGLGFADERHLWPSWHWLIEQCRPDEIFGEQVASQDGYAWLDLVSSDLEGSSYTIGAHVTPAAGFGAPHGRHRIYFVAHTESRYGWQCAGLRQGVESQQVAYRGRGAVGGLAHADGARALADDDGCGLEGVPVARLQRSELHDVDGRGEARRLVDADQPRSQRRVVDVGEHADKWALRSTSPVSGFWADAEWIPCTDGKARPVKPGTFPLAYDVASRMDKLRAYGNALVADQAISFVDDYLAFRP